MAQETELISFFVDDKSGTSHEYELNLMDAFTALIEFRFWISVMKSAKDLDNFEGVFMDNVSDDKFIKHIDKLFDKVIRDGAPISNVKETFRGELVEMLVTVVHILKANFQDLWSGKLQKEVTDAMK